MPAEIEIVENGHNGQPEVKDNEVPAANQQIPAVENDQSPAVENNQHHDVIIIETVADPDETVPEPNETVPETAESNPEPAVTVPEPLESVPEIAKSVPEIVESVPEPVEADPEPEVIIETHEDPEIIQPPPVAVQNGSNGPKKVSMTTSLDNDAVKAAYEDVRSDSSDTQWAVFKFEGSRIVLSAKGTDFQKFREQFTDNDRGFGYIRIQTGDEMSKRQKFLLITWVGPAVSVLQRAKMSTDKSVMKKIISNFAVELQLENDSEFDLKYFIKELNKAGGANYGTGIRDF